MPSVTDEREQGSGVMDAIKSLEKASKLPAQQRAVKVTGIVDTICRYAFDDGLDAASLQAVVRIVSRKTELDQTSVTTLVKNLYPAQQVPADVVVTVVGALGQGKGKPSLGTQNGLVKWLTIVYDIIDDPKTLHRCYGVLFGLLDMISIRTPLCHLLSLTTRRTHVRPFRIQQLLELSRGLGNEPALQGLLRVYKDYYPDVILLNTSATRNSFPPRPDEQWQKRLVAIQHESALSKHASFEHENGFRVLRKGQKRTKVSIIPEVHTLRASEMTVTLEEIDNVQDFVEKIDRIEPPNQMISFLTDPLLQKYVELGSPALASKRIELWLSTCLEEEYMMAKSGSEASLYLDEILEGLHKHVQYTKHLSPLVSTFLEAYLPLWNGATAFDTMIGLLSFVTVRPFKDAYAAYLGPLERALAIRGSQAYGKLLQFYTDLMQHWAFHNAQLHHPPEQEVPNFPARQHLEDLANHVSKLTLSLLLSSPLESCTPLISSILSFYETLSSSTRPGMLPIILPPPHLTYLLAQSASATTLSRVCGIYANYKTAFDRHPTPISSYYAQQTTALFNGCLRDMYNLIWGSKALLSIERSPALYCHPQLRDALNNYLAALEPEYAIGLAFGFSHHALLASLSAASWWSLEEAEIEKQGYDKNSVNYHKGPVTQQSLETLDKNRGVSVSLLEYKKHVLLWMADRGCGGVRDLMFSTHAKLKK